MINSIHIENIALIDKLNLTLRPGMNVFTGETGAGKSIIIDSISLALGSRSSREMIRSGEISGYVGVLLSDLSNQTAKSLSQYGISLEDGQLLLEREIFLDNKSVCKINSRPVTATLLKEVSTQIINIHGQHDATNLLKSQKHIELLDSYACLDDTLKNYNDAFSKYKTLKKTLEELDDDSLKKEREAEFLKFCIDEISDADIKTGEDDELLKKRKRFSDSKKTGEAIDFAFSQLYGNSDFESAKDLIYSAKSQLVQLDADYLNDYITRLNDAYYEIEDIAISLDGFKDDLDDLEDEIDDIIIRLDLISKLKKKYGPSIEDVLNYQKECEQKLDDIVFADVRKEKLEKQLSDAKKETQKLAELISSMRFEKKAELENQIKKQLEFLQMPKANFYVNIQPIPDIEKYTQKGKDKVEFSLSLNLGEQLKPLSKIASGGELSRIMLAIINVLCDMDTTSTLIFDEIDTGISGRAANAVAKRLYDISSQKQTICVTHLAQIAAMGDSHFFIEKAQQNARTATKVTLLDENTQKLELARITGGVNITDLTLKNAKEMIDLAKSYKKGEQK